MRRPEDEQRGCARTDREQCQADPGQRRRQLPETDEDRRRHRRHGDDTDDGAVELDVREFFTDRPHPNCPVLQVAVLPQQVTPGASDQQWRRSGGPVRSGAAVTQGDREGLIRTAVVRSQIRFDLERGIVRELRAHVARNGRGQLRGRVIDGVA